MSKLSLTLVKNDTQASHILDLLRFMSALVVFLFHFYVPLPGSQAVMVFFVLSGYFISSSILKAISENRWSWFDYLLRRIIRLWIVLVPALFLTYIIVKTQLGIFGEELSPPNLKISNFINPELFFGNLFFMQGILVKGAFGLNGPMWSLTYEFWYYMLFPCLVLIFRSRKKSHKVIYLFLSIVISLFVGQKIMEYFLIWLLGALIPLIKPLKLEKSYVKLIITLFVTLLAIVSMNYKAGSSYFLDLRVGLIFALLTYLIVSFFTNRSTQKYNIPNYLAGFSYTLYLTHYPLANLILTWRVSPFWPFEGNSLVIKATLALLVFGYAWVIGLLTEKHTDKVRIMISKLIFRKDVKSSTFNNNTIPQNIP
ncbi:acyltransferase family protein [Paenibacillus sp. 2RAB27]|uniref:acyltransferase family protein n=1 Tax=Paenibacillus sp. 2RAB27 TaxID=3232991 RepID=UPI003F974ED7